MRKKLQWASGIAVAATMFTALLGASGSGALAEESIPEIVETGSGTIFVSDPVVQPIETVDNLEGSAEPATNDDTLDENPAQSLAEFVAGQPHLTQLSSELHCLAGAIYFESRGEALEGQLAVGRVIVERANSSRFPDSYCGVVFQRSQFSFVRGKRMPHIRENSKAWRRAVALAQIADEGSWDSPVEGALFFHAVYVSPRWRLKRLARIDNHIFYR